MLCRQSIEVWVEDESLFTGEVQEAQADGQGKVKPWFQN